MIENRRKSKLSAVVLAAMLAGSAGGYAYAADMPVKVKAPPPPKPVPFFFVNDTSVSATWYFNSTDPGVSGGSNIVPGGIAGERNTFYRAQGSVDHFDVWEYGTNLIHLEVNQYSPKDPILGEPGAVGSRELFGFTRSTIGFNELTHSKVFSNFLFNDVGFEGGFTAGVQNNYLSEQTTQYLVGLNFDVAIPKQLGTLLVGVLARQEFTHNQFNACGPPASAMRKARLPALAAAPASAAARSTATATSSGIGTSKSSTPSRWAASLAAGPIHSASSTLPTSAARRAPAFPPRTAWRSAASVAVAGFNNNETKTEVFEDVRLSLDASKVFWTKPGIWDAYVGYRYWYNKFGTNHNAALFSTLAPGTSIESTAYVGTTYHFK